MKSAGERSDRNNDPIKNAISAMISTVDSGYVFGIRTIVDVIGGVVLFVSVLGSPPGSFGTLSDDDRRDNETDGTGETGILVGDEVQRNKALGYAFRNPNNPPPDGGDGTVCVTVPFSGASYNIYGLGKRYILSKQLTTGDPLSASSVFGPFSSGAVGSSLISMVGTIAS